MKHKKVTAALCVVAMGFLSSCVTTYEPSDKVLKADEIKQLVQGNTVLWTDSRGSERAPFRYYFGVNGEAIYAKYQHRTDSVEKTDFAIKWWIEEGKLCIYEKCGYFEPYGVGYQFKEQFGRETPTFFAMEIVEGNYVTARNPVGVAAQKHLAQ